MFREAIATGNTVEEAIENAKQELGAEDEFDISVEVLQTPTKKTLGLFGGNPAKVRVSFDDGRPEPKKPVSEEPAKAAPKAKKESKKAAGKLENPAKQASAYISEVLTNMGVDGVEIDIIENEAGAALVLSGGDVGFIIGHRGETLDSLQYLASLVANHVEEKYYRITLDVGNYRAKRKETLESLGKKMALKSIKIGRNNHLEPMNPYERRIIHTAVQEIDGAKSWSEGEDMGRHVVIGPEGGERRGSGYNRDGRDRGGYNRNRNPGGRGGYNRNAGNASRLQNSAPAERKQDDPTARVYGKIDVPKPNDGEE